MQLKVVKGTKARTIDAVDNIEIEEVPENCVAVKSGLDTPGIVIEVTRLPPHRSCTIRVPSEADVVYVINDAGKTTDRIRWPRRLNQD